jgi:hypothetical protein
MSPADTVTINATAMGTLLGRGNDCGGGIRPTWRRA